MEEQIPIAKNVHEQKWIGRVLAGHKEEYALLVNLYKDKIYGLLRGMGADHQDAQDLTQETFIKAYRKLASHDTDKSFAAWIYKIANNLLKDLRRKTHPIKWVAEPPQNSWSEGNPEKSLLQGENSNEIQALLLQLPTNYRIAMLLRYTNDLSYEEMSEVLDLPVNKIQNDLYRAKKKMKQMLIAREEKIDEMLKCR